MENYYKKEVKKMQEEAKRKEAYVSNAYASFLAKVKRDMGGQLNNKVLKSITSAFDLGLELGVNGCNSQESGYSIIEGMIRQNTKNPEKRS